MTSPDPSVRAPSRRRPAPTGRRRSAPPGQSSSARWVLAAPLLLFAAVFAAYPLFQGIQTGFYDLSLQSPDVAFTGLSNFATVLGDANFRYAARFTATFALTVTAVETVLGFLLALAVNRAFPGKKLFFTMLLMPIMVAPALLGVMFRLLLNGDIGLVPAVLHRLGWDVSLFAPESIVGLLVLLDILQWTPFTFLIIYAGLQSFPTEILEAAQIDGAARLRTVTSVIIPVLSPTIFAAVFLRLIDAIRTFDVIYVLTAGGPGLKTTTISIHIYKTAFEAGHFSEAAAASTIVMLALILLVPILVRRIVRTEGDR